MQDANIISKDDAKFPTGHTTGSQTSSFFKEQERHRLMNAEVLNFQRRLPLNEIVAKLDPHREQAL